MILKPTPTPIIDRTDETPCQIALSSGSEPKFKLYNPSNESGERPDPMKLFEENWERDKAAYEFIGR